MIDSSSSMRGVGLLEILVGLCISTGMIMGLMYAYTVVKRHTLTRQAALAEAYDVAHVTDWMQTRIRAAGFTPCAQVERLITFDHRTGLPLSAVNIKQVPYSELRINHMQDLFSTLVSSPKGLMLHARGGVLLNSNHPVMISDCYHAEVLKAESIETRSDGQSVQLNQSLVFTYHAPVYIGSWLEDAFSIRHTGDKTALFYQGLHPEALSTSVHDFNARLLRDAHGQGVLVTLQLSDKQAVSVDTMVRSP